MSVIVSDETWYVDARYDYKHCFDLPLCVAHEILERILHSELFSYFDSCQTTSGKQLENSDSTFRLSALLLIFKFKAKGVINKWLQKFKLVTTLSKKMKENCKCIVLSKQYLSPLR